MQASSSIPEPQLPILSLEAGRNAGEYIKHHHHWQTVVIPDMVRAPMDGIGTDLSTHGRQIMAGFSVLMYKGIINGYILGSIAYYIPTLWNKLMCTTRCQSKANCETVCINQLPPKTSDMAYSIVQWLCPAMVMLYLSYRWQSSPMANAREIYEDLQRELKADRLLAPKLAERMHMLNNLFANAQDGIRAAQRNRNLRSAERREVFNINLQLFYLKGKQALLPVQRPKTS